MVTVDGTRERLRYSLDQALEAADDEQARYHIRIAAQRLIVLQALDEPAVKPTVGSILDDGDGESDGTGDRPREQSTDDATGR